MSTAIKANNVYRLLVGYLQDTLDIVEGDPLALIGKVLGGTYKVVRLLGVGGMGSVYEAENVRIGKRFAVKVLSSLASANKEVVRRFRREAQIATDLGHPHIVEVIDFNETPEGMSYMVMEFLDGEDLDSLLCREKSLSLQQAIAIVHQVCSALQAAHGRHIIHRDLKPANVFLCKRGTRTDYVKVVDFGISKIIGATSLLTQEDSLLGTPSYMAPEQVQGQISRIGPWTDIFAIGNILYQMLYGRPAFVGGSLMEIAYQSINNDPPPLQNVCDDLPEGFIAVVEKAMAKEPKQRFSSMKGLSEKLHEILPSGLPGHLADLPWDDEGDPEERISSASETEFDALASTLDSDAGGLAIAPTVDAAWQEELGNTPTLSTFSKRRRSARSWPWPKTIWT